MISRRSLCRHTGGGRYPGRCATSGFQVAQSRTL